MPWFVLNYIPISLAATRKKAPDWITRFNETYNLDLRIFAPTFFACGANDKQGLRQVPLTFHYVFVKGEFDHIKKLCLSGYGFYFVLLNSDPDSKEYATVTDQNMQAFMRIARRFSNSLPYYPLDEICLEDGDYVRIMEGDFAGLEGYFFPKAKSTKGRLVIQVAKNTGTAVFDIPTRYIRVISFSKKSNVKYHALERFVPRLQAILAKQKAGEPLTEGEIAELSIFIRRMGIARMEKPLAEAKLAALLLASARIIGDSETASLALKRLEKIIPRIESQQTLSLVSQLTNP